MTKYVYHYFNVRGRGELARLVFAAAGVEYTDNRVPNEAWEENDCDNSIVNAAPCGTLPYVEFDGIKITGSTVVARFLANEFHLAGKNNVEAAEIDAFIETVFDAYMSWLHHVQVKRDPSEKVFFGF
jgi:glutathione S-transferase